MEHFFGVSRKKINNRLGARIDKIAQRHGASFTWAQMPEGPMCWFSCPNLGFPFDKAIEEDVWGDLEQAGLANENGLIF